MKYTNKEQLLQDCRDEIALNMGGITCAPRHVKLLCRNRIQYVKWKMSRIERNLPFDNVPTTKSMKEIKCQEGLTYA